jgi:hypothetical protein
MDLWYRIVISRSTLPPPPDLQIRILMSDTHQRLKIAGYPQDARIFRTNNFSIYFFSPEAVAVLQQKWIDDHSAEVCQKPDLDELQEVKIEG